MREEFLYDKNGEEIIHDSYGMNSVNTVGTINRDLCKENSRMIIDKLNQGAAERKRAKWKAFQKDTTIKV